MKKNSNASDTDPRMAECAATMEIPDEHDSEERRSARKKKRGDSEKDRPRPTRKGTKPSRNGSNSSVGEKKSRTSTTSSNKSKRRTEALRHSTRNEPSEPAVEESVAIFTTDEKKEVNEDAEHAAKAKSPVPTLQLLRPKGAIEIFDDGPVVRYMLFSSHALSCFSHPTVLCRARSVAFP